LIVQQLDGATALLGAEDSDQSFGKAPFVNDGLDEFFFVVPALEMLVGCCGFVGQGTRVLDEGFGLLLDKRDEILAEHVEAVVDKAVEVTIAPKRQVPFEKDAVSAGKNGYNRVSEALLKAGVRRHGVLLPGWFGYLLE
jgi:hypothetical protein